MKIYHFESLQLPFVSTVATVGMFDGVHLGHRVMIEALRKEADQLQATPIVLTFNEHPRSVLNKDVENLKMLNTMEERMTLLEKAGVEHLVLISFDKAFAALSAVQFLELLHQKVNLKEVLIGYDNHFGKTQSDNADLLKDLAEKCGFSIIRSTACVLQDGVEISSTQIRQALQSGDIPLANAMLSYEYSFEGEVKEGLKNGRKMGFPTANLSTDPHKQLPMSGVYAVRVTTKANPDIIYGGMLNLGTRPTFGLKDFSVEVHLLNFEGSLYGERLVVYPIQKIRDEKYFSSIDLLKQQLSLDKQMILNLLNHAQE